MKKTGLFALVWRNASRAAGMPDFHFHDLRHDGAMKALNSGFSFPILKDLGRWKRPEMVERSAKATNKTLRLAAEAVSCNIGNGHWQRASQPFVDATS